jgi:hypothetical protein
MRILDNKLIDKYDYKSTKRNVDQFMLKFEENYFKYINILPPSITSHLSEVKVDSSISTTSGVERYVEAKETAEEELLKNIQIILKIVDNFDLQEQYYFKDTYINGLTESSIEEKVQLSKKGIEHVKKSAIIKFALALNIEVLKDQ